MDRARAEAMIRSGRIYTAEELHEMGVVDVLAEDGQGQLAVQDYIARHQRKFNAYHATIGRGAGSIRSRWRSCTMSSISGPRRR